MSPDPSPVRVADLIAESVLVINDGYRAKNEELASVGLPFARAGNIDGGFKFGDADCFPERNLRLVGNKVSQPGDVVFTSKGTVGRVAYVAESTPRFVYSPQLCFWRALDRGRLHPRWLFYWMQSSEFREQCDGVKGQTDMADYVSLRDQRAMSISLPPVDEQRAIGLLLGALDDRIELNRRMNQTLETMARATFRSWFVDFDPVVAKAAGRQPFGISADVAALFPDRFIGTEVGSAPVAWESFKWGDISTLEYGKSLRSHGVAGGAVRVYGTNGPIGWHTEALCPTAGVVIGRKGAYRGIHYSPTPFFVIDTAFYLKPKREFEIFWAYYELLSLNINGMDSGSAIPSTSRDEFYQVPVLFPPAPIRAEFGKVVGPMFRQIEANQEQSGTLAALRDALLPKLMSGELRVRDAEKLVGTHV